MNLQKLYSYTRRAIQQYDLIQAHDRIASGSSGGKDSLTLLYALAGLRRFYPTPFELEAITVDLGFDMDFTAISDLCHTLDVNYTIVQTEIAQIVSRRATDSYSCSLCAKLRKGALNQQAQALDCNKIAYAHHMDDVVDTFILSLNYESRLYSFSPYTYLEQTGLTLIRPLISIPEYEILSFVRKYQLPIVENLCPADGATTRTHAHTFLEELYHKDPTLRKRLFTAIENSDIQDWQIARNRSKTPKSPTHSHKQPGGYDE